MNLHGENIKIYSGGQVIALATSCTINVTADSHEKASATSASAKDWLAGRTDWRVSITRFVDNMQSQMIMAGRKYVITMYVDNGDMLTGPAICSEVRTEATAGKLAQGFCTLIGNGELV